jgi:hypothetical protein
MRRAKSGSSRQQALAGTPAKVRRLFVRLQFLSTGENVFVEVILDLHVFYLSLCLLSVAAFALGGGSKFRMEHCS